MREKNGFSLMEMMVVLLIMSIIAAATAPIVSKKMMQSSKSNASPWVFTGQGKNIAYNMGGLDNATAIIGAAKVPEGTNARLYIDCGNNASQIALGSGDTAANILADPVGKRVGIDKTKTPQVGVIAQDLQKVFPDAVKLDGDGYLSIRWDDMFYAVINAVKELDAKITAFAEDITGMKDEIKTLKEQNKNQQKIIEDLEKRLSELEKNQAK